MVWRKGDREEGATWPRTSPTPRGARPAQPCKFFQCFLVRLYPRREMVNGFYRHRSYCSMSVVCPARVPGRASLCLGGDLTIAAVVNQAGCTWKVLKMNI